MIRELEQGIDQWFVLKMFCFLMLQNLSVFAVGEWGSTLSVIFVCVSGKI